MKAKEEDTPMMKPLLMIVLLVRWLVHVVQLVLLEQ